jgi:DNA-binding response OmpR family regulator
MPSNVRVLLVDDNPMVLEMLRQSLAQISTVSTTTDGGEALLKAIDEAPDLVVSDYTLEGMNGRQLLEKLRGRPQTAKIPFIMVASKSDITDKLKMIQDMVEDFLEKPFFIKETVARIKKVIDKIALEKMAREAPTASDGTLRGSLSQMSIMDLLQSLEMGHKNCELILTNNGDRCDMYFSDGQINHAVYGKITGDEAVYKVLTWTTGNFQIDFNGSSTQTSTTRSTQGLLMEGLRLLDEANREGEADVLEA